MPLRVRALVLAVLAGCTLVLAAGPPARAQEPPTPTPASPLHPELDADMGPERPVELPPSLTAAQVDPRMGIHFGLGLPVMDVRSETLDVRVKGGAPAERGVLLHVEAVLHAFRVGYARQLFRADLPPETVLEGTAVDGLAIDSHQLWAFHGWRVHHSVYLGYGLGWQRRRIRVLSGETAARARSGSAFMAGLVADWAFRLPFALQLRAFEDLSDGFVVARGASLQLAYTVGF